MTCSWDALDWIFAGLYFVTGFSLYPVVHGWLSELHLGADE